MHAMPLNWAGTASNFREMLRWSTVLTFLLTTQIGLAMSAELSEDSAHQFSFVSIDGQALPLSQFSGKAVLLVNTASRCGFTGQYAALQELWQRYQERGLVVLGVPSNDFGSQRTNLVTSFATY